LIHNKYQLIILIYKKINLMICPEEGAAMSSASIYGLMIAKE